MVEERREARTSDLALLVDTHLQMNHSLPGVNAGYVTKGKLLSHLRQQQERISAFILSAGAAEEFNERVDNRRGD